LQDKQFIHSSQQSTLSVERMWAPRSYPQYCFSSCRAALSALCFNTMLLALIKKLLQEAGQKICHYIWGQCVVGTLFTHKMPSEKQPEISFGNSSESWRNDSLLCNWLCEWTWPWLLGISHPVWSSLVAVTLILPFSLSVSFFDSSLSPLYSLQLSWCIPFINGHKTFMEPDKGINK
jgi:hypothetical protein